MSAIQMFRNAMFYRLTCDEMPADLRGSAALNNQLCENKARDPGTQELTTVGFVSPFGVDGMYFERSGNGAIYVTIEKAERLLPGTAIRQAVAKRVAEIEKAEQRKVYAKEKSRIREEIVHARLPHTFIQKTRISALIDWPYIIVDAASPKKAELLLSLLREALGSLPVRPVTVKAGIEATMTSWVRDCLILDSRLYLGERFKSSVPCEKGESLSGSGVDFNDEKINAILDAGHQVTELALLYANTEGMATDFTLTKTLVLKGIRFDDALSQQAADDCGDDDSFATFQSATLMLVVHELRGIRGELLEALGGEELPKSLSDTDADDAEELV